jgi:hypothetical protein
MLYNMNNALFLEVSSVPVIRFSEQNWYKGKCKSALVMPFSLYKSPDLYISFQVKNDL